MSGLLARLAIGAPICLVAVSVARLRAADRRARGAAAGNLAAGTGFLLAAIASRLLAPGPAQDLALLAAAGLGLGGVWRWQSAVRGRDP